MLQCMFSGKDEFVIHQPIESSSLISFSLYLPFSQADGTGDDKIFSLFNNFLENIVTRFARNGAESSSNRL